MIKIILIFAIFASTSGARLDHLQYVPPQQQPQHGGQGPNLAGYPKHEQQGGGYPGSSQQQGHNTVSGPHGNVQPAPNNYNNGAEGQSHQDQPQYNGEPQQRSPLVDVPIVRLENENIGDGNYRYAYETGNGIAAQERGTSQTGWNNAQGSYQFTSPEGETFEITYTADENGYQPQGAHLPTPPPIPDAILKSLELIRQAEAEGRLEGQYQPEGDDGQYRVAHNNGGEHGVGNQEYQQQQKEQHQGNSPHVQQSLSQNGSYRY